MHLLRRRISLAVCAAIRPFLVGRAFDPCYGQCFCCILFSPRPLYLDYATPYQSSGLGCYPKRGSIAKGADALGFNFVEDYQRVPSRNEWFKFLSIALLGKKYEYNIGGRPRRVDCGYAPSVQRTRSSLFSFWKEIP